MLNVLPANSSNTTFESGKTCLTISDRAPPYICSTNKSDICMTLQLSSHLLAISQQQSQHYQLSVSGTFKGLMLAMPATCLYRY
jgi:hypothetical protein